MAQCVAPAARRRCRQEQRHAGEQRAEHLESGHEVQHDKHKEYGAIGAVAAAHGTQERRVERLNCKRSKDQRQHGNNDARDGDDQEQGWGIDRENRAEQHVHEIEMVPRSDTMSTPTPIDAK